MQPHGLTASHGVWSCNNGCKHPKKISLIWTCDRAISLIFLHRVILWVKRIVLVNGSQLTRSTYTVQSRFQNHVYRLFKHFFNVDNVLVWRFKGFDSKSFCFCVFFFFGSVCLLRTPQQISMASNLIISWGLLARKDWILQWHKLGW